MKNLLKTCLALCSLTMFFWGGFLLPTTKALTVYQQLTLNDNYYPVTNTSGNSCDSGTELPLAHFIPTQNVDMNAGSSLFFVANSNLASMSPGSISFVISTSSQRATPTNSSRVTFDSVVIPYDDSDHFLIATTSSAPANSYLFAGLTYYVTPCWTAGSSQPLVRVGFPNDGSGQLFYGYIADANGNTVPIVPGISGFTDVGISPTAQQTYCANNFSTSTGLISSIGNDIALGLCNVLVFLVIPSNQAVSQWQSFSSTTATKIPFSYFYELKSLYQSQVATSAPSFVNWTIDFSNAPTTSSYQILPRQITVLSTSTVSTYLSDTQRNLLRNLLAYTIWLSFAYVVYRRVTMMFTKTQ